MAKCTAPVRGHSSAAAEAACPACRYRTEGYNYNPSYSSPVSGGSGYRSGGTRPSMPVVPDSR